MHERITQDLHSAKMNIQSDYSSHFGHCDYAVANTLVDATLDKINDGPLGTHFAADTLTIAIGDVSFNSDKDITKIIHDLPSIYVVHKGKQEQFKFKDTYGLISEHGGEYMVMSYSDSVKMENNGHRVANLSYALEYMSLHREDASKICGMRYTRWFNRNIEPLAPGTLDKLSVAFGVRDTKKLYLTIDPSIMINASEHARFSSCFTFDGEYHYSTHGYIRCQNAAMAFMLDDEGFLVYRRWVLLSDNMQSTTFLQSYTSLRREYIDDAVKPVLCDFLIGEADAPEAEDSSLEARIYDDADAYIDPHWTYHLVGNDVKPHYNLPCGIDIMTGYGTDMPDVQGSVCDCCGDRYHRDDLYLTGDDYLVCDSCLNNEYTWVESRDNYYPTDDTIENVYGTVYHIDDIDRDHVMCEWHEQYIPEQEAVYCEEEGVSIHIDHAWEAEDGQYFTTESQMEEHNAAIAEEIEE